MKTQENNVKVNRKIWPIFESIGQAASQIGCRETLLKSAKRAGCKAFLPGNRVDTAILLPFLFATQKGTEPDRFDLQAEKLIEETRKLKRENDLADGEIISVADADIRFGRIVSALVEGLDAIPSMVPGISLEQRMILVQQIERCKEQGRQA